MMEFTLSDRRRGARWYDPAAGRWWGVDAMAEAYYSISPFAYVANNPVIFIDPNGEEIWISISGGSRVQYRDGQLWTNYGKQEKYEAEKGSFAAQSLAALNHILEDGGTIGAILINRLSLSKGDENWLGNVEILENTTSSNRGRAFSSGTDGMITWDPNSGVIVNEQGGMISPSLVLAHELGHIFNKFSNPEEHDRRLADNKNSGLFNNEEERYNIGLWEKYIGKSFREKGYGEAVRNHHKGVYFETEGVKSNKPLIRTKTANESFQDAIKKIKSLLNK
ncbi:MAG: RHS repeat-associated core domain-containing protein [Bacteroidia bacterium]